MKIFLTKSIVLLALFLLLQIPLSWTQFTINERSQFRQEAINAIAQNQAGAQTIVGPILILPYTRTYWVENKDSNQNTVKEQLTETRTIELLPSNFEVDTHSQVEERKKGIFPVPIFNNVTTLKGDFKLPDVNTLKINPDDDIQFGKSTLAISVSDQRGIKSAKATLADNNEITLLPGTDLNIQNNQGLHGVINSDVLVDNTSFTVKLSLNGTKSYSVVPIGSENKIKADSNWPHPQFIGNQLPDGHQINDSGFQANWQTSELATNISSLWTKCLLDTTKSCSDLLNQSVGISLFEPVDIYQQATRTTKYGLLFLIITFSAFLLYEVLCNLNIHPVQYGLVGLALALFFLLLLGFAEQIGFSRAYLIASGSCISLLGFYVHAILRHWLRTGVFIAVLAGLYVSVYIILQLEDAALLTGSVLLFALLSLAMMLTRKIDWYQWQHQLTQKPTEVIS